SGEVDDHGCIHPRICRADSRDAHPRSKDMERPAATRHMPRLEYAARCQVAEVGHRGAALIEARPGQPWVALVVRAQKNRTACTVRFESRWLREGGLCRAYFSVIPRGRYLLDPSRDQRAFSAGAAAASLAALRLLRVRSPKFSAAFCATPRISWPAA